MRPDEGVLAFLILILAAAILTVVYTGQRRQQQTAIRKAVIEKFSSAQDLAQFMETPGGQRLIGGIFGKGSGAAPPLLASVQKGVILVAVGVALVLIGLVWAHEAIYVGFLLFALGAGFLISARITFRLSRSWGLMEEPPASNQPKV